MGEVIAITSGKGGAGKTMITANLGAAISLKDKKVVLVDMDMGLRNLDIALGLENRVVYDVADVLDGVCRVKQAIIKDRRFESLYLLPAPQSKSKKNITVTHLKVLCDILKEKFDYVIIDSPAGIDSGFIISATGADMAIIVTMPEIAAVRDADMVDKMLKEMDVPEIKLIINRAKVDLIEKGMLPSITEVSEMLRVDLIGIIPEDENIYIATNNGIPIVVKQGSYVEKNFSKIAMRIIGEKIRL